MTALAPLRTLDWPATRIVQVEGDHMEPTLRGGRDYVVCLPIDHYAGEGLYVIDQLGLPLVYRFESDFQGGIAMLRDNKLYREQPPSLTRQQFEQMVLAKVVAKIIAE